MCEHILEFIHNTQDEVIVSCDECGLTLTQEDLLFRYIKSREVLKDIKRFLEHGPEFPYHLLVDTEELQEKVKQVLEGDKKSNDPTS